jgi:hypothetical protein
LAFLFFIRDTFRKTLGVILVIPGIILFLTGLFGIFEYVGKDPATSKIVGFIVLGFSICLIATGVVLFIQGKRLTVYENKIRKLVSIIQTFRRINISDLANKLEVNNSEIEGLIEKAVELELISGHMDMNTSEFFIDESLNDKKISTCPNCGAALAVAFYKGETAKCPACGSLFR